MNAKLFLPLLLIFLFTSPVKGQENNREMKLGVYGSILPGYYGLYFSPFFSGGITLDKSTAHENRYWSSSINYSGFSLRYPSRHSLLLSSGFNWKIAKGWDKHTWLAGVQMGYLYENWYCFNDQSAFNVNSLQSRFSTELTFKLKNSELGVLIHMGLGYGYRSYADPKKLNGPVVSGYRGGGLIYKFPLGKKD